MYRNFINKNDPLMNFYYVYNFSNDFHRNLHFLEMCLHMQIFIKNKFIVNLFPIVLFVTVNIIK